VLEIVERNARLRERIALFEIAPIFLVSEEGILPDEPLKLVITLSGRRYPQGWQSQNNGDFDFFDLKGIVEVLLTDLHIQDVRYLPYEHPSFHPGKCARVVSKEQHLGIIGEVHPLVKERYDLTAGTLLAGEFDLQSILNQIQQNKAVQSVPPFPPAYEDLAVVVDEALPAQNVAETIRKAAGITVTEIRLFDVYRGERIGVGKKSLAYSLTYQDSEKTLTDEAVSKIRQRIIQQLDQELGAKLRS
jgi:phenylalanyl-tRNA synthetase beta chain